MGYINALLIFALFIISYKTDHFIYSPIAFFCLEWGIIILLASLRLFGLFEASFQTWLIISLGTFSYISGVLICKHFMHVEHGFSNDSALFTTRSFCTILLIVIAFKIPQLFNSINALCHGASLDDIRHASYGLTKLQYYVDFDSSPIFQYLEVIISILELFIEAAGIEMFFYNNKSNYRYLLSVLLIVLIDSFINGGRFQVFYFLIEILACYEYYRKRMLSTSSKRKVYSKYVFILIAFLCIVIFGLTIFRGTQINELFAKLYRYICGNIIFFDIHIQRINSNDFYSMSMAGLYGFWAILFPILHKFGLPYPKIYTETIIKVMNTQNFIKIGKRLMTNAFCTPYYYLYSDFRYFGVVLGMICFGIIVEFVYKNVEFSNGRKQLTLYLIVIQIIFMTLDAYPFSSKVYSITIIIILIIEYRIYKRSYN